MPVKILVTGFGAFPGARSNPSALLVRALAKHQQARLERLGIELHTAILPVEFHSIANTLQRVSDSVSPHAILHIGLAGRRRQVCVELRARNHLSLLHPDARRQFPASPQVMPGASALISTFPVIPVRQVLRAAGLDARLSMDAGDYVCNQTLFLTLHRNRVQAGFIHIPKLAARNRPAGSSKPRPTLEQLVRGIYGVVVVMVVAGRLQKNANSR